jgi:UDP-perosamine 4-acetyltransferase
MPRTRLIIVGAGRLSLDVFEAADLSGRVEPVGFVVSDGAALQREHCGLPVVDVEHLPWPADAAVSIGAIANPSREQFLAELRRRGYDFEAVLHPSAIVSRSATIGPGAFIGAGAILAARATVREDVVISRGANVGPDVDVGACSTIGAGAIIAGSVAIGAGAFIGVGAVVRDHVTIGRGAVIGAGAVIVKPVPEGTLVAGSPGQSIG